MDYIFLSHSDEKERERDTPEFRALFQHKKEFELIVIVRQT